MNLSLLFTLCSRFEIHYFLKLSLRHCLFINSIFLEPKIWVVVWSEQLLTEQGVVTDRSRCCHYERWQHDCPRGTVLFAENLTPFSPTLRARVLSACLLVPIHALVSSAEHGLRFFISSIKIKSKVCKCLAQRKSCHFHLPKKRKSGENS